MKNTLLLAGFAPWDHYERNAAWEALRGQDGSLMAGWRLRCVQLPVSWQRAWPTLREAWSDDVGAVVAFGQAEDDAIRLERFAVNASSREAPDVDGDRFESDWIVDGGGHALHTRLPWQSLQRALTAAELPVRVSHSAGDYLCNHLAYCLLDHVQRQGSDIPAGFIHVPTLARIGLEPLQRMRQLVIATVVEASPELAI